MTKNEFIQTLAMNARKVVKELNLDYAQYAVCCAQACCESNYGQSSLMSKANAYFGIKATSSWCKAAKYGGKCYSAKTKECYDGKNYVSIRDSFRAYNSMSDSLRDYFDLLCTRRYNKALKAQTVEEAIKIIHEGGYATSPTYQQTIISFYKSIKAIIDAVWNEETISVEKVHEYMVVPGDNLTKISKMFNTTIAKLICVNRAKYPKMTRDYIQVGWILKV